MEDSLLPPDLVDYVVSIRGSDLSVDLTNRKIAHFVLDMQNAFVSAGAIAETKATRTIVENINRLSDAVRESGGRNYFFRFTYDPAWTAYYAGLLPEHLAEAKGSLSPGCEQHALWSGIDQRDDDVVLDKKRFSPFVDTTCELRSRLAQHEPDVILISGCLSNCCCESTARDAIQLNYPCVFVADACAAKTGEEHRSAISDLFSLFGCSILTTAEVIEPLSKMLSATSDP